MSYPYTGWVNGQIHTVFSSLLNVETPSIFTNVLSIPQAYIHHKKHQMFCQITLGHPLCL